MEAASLSLVPIDADSGRLGRVHRLYLEPFVSVDVRTIPLDSAPIRHEQGTACAAPGLTIHRAGSEPRCESGVGKGVSPWQKGVLDARSLPPFRPYLQERRSQGFSLIRG